jgi:hypothetical protein
MSKTWAMVRSLLVHRGENGRISDPPGRRPMGARPHFPHSQRCRTSVHAGGRFCLQPTGHFGSVAGILFASVVIANSQPCRTTARTGGRAVCRAWPVRQSDWHPIRSCGDRLRPGRFPPQAEPRDRRGGLGASALKGRRGSCAVLRIAASGANDADQTRARKERLNDDDARAG